MLASKLQALHKYVFWKMRCKVTYHIPSRIYCNYNATWHQPWGVESMYQLSATWSSKKDKTKEWRD